ncbi:MAG: hypothetical protein ACRC57_11695 [Sarcina sp.]
MEIGNQSRGARVLRETSVLIYGLVLVDKIEDPRLKELAKEILAAAERGENNLKYFKN